MKLYHILAVVKTTVFLSFISYAHISLASGGYDNGTPAGAGKLDIEITINPGDMIDYGQSYLVWGYGLTDQWDFHGYMSHAAGGEDQIYYGLMYNFYSHQGVDLSTALGVRHIRNRVDVFLPQLLYTIQLSQGFDVIGSVVNVFDSAKEKNLGVSFDIALRLPVPAWLTPSFVKDTKFAVGAFRSVSGNIYPTYSIDLRF